MPEPGMLLTEGILTDLRLQTVLNAFLAQFPALAKQSHPLRGYQSLRVMTCDDV